MNRDRIEYVLSACEGFVASGMSTKWEEDFIHSVREQFERDGQLSNHQENTMEFIYYKVP